MKGIRKKPKISDLTIDTIEYVFTKWLIRRGLFAAFKANYNACCSSPGSFRDRLRFHIRACFCNCSFGPSELISSAFLYASTPEGVNFWLMQSAVWKKFYASLKKEL